MIEAEVGRASAVTAYQRSGPTVLRILLGGQLRRLRESKHITRSEAGEAIRASDSKISRLELGRVAFKERDVSDLLTLYGVIDEDERALFTSLGRQANKPGWWHKYSDIMPSWFELYVGLEEAASLVRTYEVQFVPGLLQTEDYAREVALLGHPNVSSTEIARRVELRMARQERLRAEDGLRIWAIIDEAVLRRPLGGSGVMRAQLGHLADMSSLPNVTFQVVPFDRGGHAAAGGPFTILRFSEPDLPDVVYLEQLSSALYLDDRDDVDGYMAVMDRLCVDAASSADTMKMLHGIIKET
ncbi:helix-turn-helix domain-containing protein [Actinomadura alba]|uniref:Helix-turn-helix domain-containing protein n=1 Tax=Actinomadura alba TaxID=406431 RepID=A0ABR7LXL6_9ACTN|nr:helix-turn-helix transcriptional regulator [Actinomadura alba]MBC6469598.1 helix-turn-helix domain-containing protein [Actinomadura alba]